MAPAPETTSFDRAVGPVLQLLLPEKAGDVLNFHPEPALRERIEELASKSTEGGLTEDDRTEYEGYVRANKFIAILQKHARRLLASES